MRYVLEGSVQRDQNRVRVNAQLIDAGSGAHLWADRFDRPLADLFSMQDEIVASLASQLDVEMIANEARRAERTPNPNSMDLYFQGMSWFNKGRMPKICRKRAVSSNAPLRSIPAISTRCSARRPSICRSPPAIRQTTGPCVSPQSRRRWCCLSRRTTLAYPRAHSSQSRGDRKRQLCRGKRVMAQREGSAMTDRSGRKLRTGPLPGRIGPGKPRSSVCRADGGQVQMQHAPINDPARYRLQKLGMGNAPEVVREVGVHNFRMAAKQQFFHLDHRLFGRFARDGRRRVPVEGRLRRSAPAPASLRPGASDGLAWGPASEALNKSEPCFAPPRSYNRLSRGATKRCCIFSQPRATTRPES